MVNRDQAIKAAWRLFATTAPASEIREVEANLIEGTWSVLFHKQIGPDHVECPDCWIILVPASGRAEWLDVL